MLSIFLPVLSVVLGFVLALFFKNRSKTIQLLLSFSGAFLLSVTIFEFLPEVYYDYSSTIGLLIMGGILLQIFLEFLSKGAEHGHLHHNETQQAFPFLLFFSLCVHSLMEGFPISNNIHLLLGVVIHKIPVAVIITSFLMTSDMSKKKIAVFLVIFALMTPLGSVFNQYVVISSTIRHYINAVVIGIFLHISTTILFESSKNHQFDWSKILLIVLGIATAFFI